MLDPKQPYIDSFLIYRLIDYVITNVIVVLIMAYTIPYQFITYLIFITLAIAGLMLHDNKHSIGKTCLYYLEDDFSDGKDKRYKYVKLLHMSIRVIVKYLPLMLLAVFGKRLSLTTYIGFTASFMFLNYIWCLITVGEMMHDTFGHTNVFLTNNRLFDKEKQPKPRYKAKKKASKNTVSRIDLKVVKSILDKENVRNSQDFIIEVDKEEIQKKKKEKRKKKQNKKAEKAVKKDDVQQPIASNTPSKEELGEKADAMLS